MMKKRFLDTVEPLTQRAAGATRPPHPPDGIIVFADPLHSHRLEDSQAKPSRSIGH